MKGIIFKAFESFVTENWGDQFYEDLLDASELQSDGAFVGPGTYPDEDLFALVGTAIARLNISLDDALKAFGRYAFDKLAGTAPQFVDGIDDAKAFLATVDSVIHVEVRKLYPQANTPSVILQDTGPNQATLIYESDRQICPLMVGLVEGMADYFSTKIEHEEVCCTRQGAPRCEFHLTFAP